MGLIVGMTEGTFSNPVKLTNQISLHVWQLLPEIRHASPGFQTGKRAIPGQSLQSHGEVRHPKAFGAQDPQDLEGVRDSRGGDRGQGDQTRDGDAGSAMTDSMTHVTEQSPHMRHR